jgi:hypothetical protein
LSELSLLVWCPTITLLGNRLLFVILTGVSNANAVALAERVCARSEQASLRAASSNKNLGQPAS